MENLDYLQLPYFFFDDYVDEIELEEDENDIDDEFDYYNHEVSDENKHYNLQYYYNLIMFDETLKRIKEREYSTTGQISQFDYINFFDACDVEYLGDERILLVNYCHFDYAYKMSPIFEECELILVDINEESFLIRLEQYIAKNRLK